MIAAYDDHDDVLIAFSSNTVIWSPPRFNLQINNIGLKRLQKRIEAGKSWAKLAGEKFHSNGLVDHKRIAETETKLTNFYNWSSFIVRQHTMKSRTQMYNCTWHHAQGGSHNCLQFQFECKKKLLTLLTAFVMCNYHKLRARSSIIELKNTARHCGKEESLDCHVVPSPEWLTQEREKKAFKILHRAHTRLLVSSSVVTTAFTPLLSSLFPWLTSESCVGKKNSSNNRWASKKSDANPGWVGRLIGNTIQGLKVFSIKI